MKILMVCTNTYRSLAAAPLGASLVGSRLRHDGHQVRFLDLMFAKAPAAEAARLAHEFQPDLVCYALRNVDSQSYSFFFDPAPLQALVSAVRAAWPAPTLLGGTAFTTFPARFLEVLQADYGLAGDDLAPISHFVASLAAGQPDDATPGLVWREESAVRCNPFVLRGYADTSFDGWDFLDLHRYRRSFDCYWEAAVVVRTGCPFHCVYCDTFRTFGRRWVPRDPRQVAEELVALRRLHGVRSVFLADAGFNRPLDHAKRVLEALVAARPGVPLTAIFEPGEVDAEFAQLFRRAGGRALMVFAGSLSDPVLEALRKPFRWDQVREGAETLQRAGVSPFLYLTFGAPGETLATVEETLSRISRIHPSYTLIDQGFRIQPGTVLRDLAVAEGVLASEDDCFKASFYHSPHTPPALLEARLQDYRARHRWDQSRGLPWIASLMWDKLRP